MEQEIKKIFNDDDLKEGSDFINTWAENMFQLEQTFRGPIKPFSNRDYNFLQIIGQSISLVSG